MPKRNQMKLPRPKYKPGDIIEMTDNPGKYYEVKERNTYHPDIQSWSYYCEPRYQPHPTDNYPVQRLQYECWTRLVKGQMTMFGKNRQARLELYKKLTEAAHTKKALNWALGRDRTDEVHITPQTIKGEAVQFVRNIFGEYHFPNTPKFSFSGMKRSEQARAGELNEAIVTVEGMVRAASGANIVFYVPVMVREGKLLEPSLFFRDYNDGVGVPMVIGQHAIDALVRDNTTYGQTPTREMFQAPGSTSRKAPNQERHAPGLFSTAAARTALRESIRTGGAKVAWDCESIALELINKYGYDIAEQKARAGLNNAADSESAAYWLDVVDWFHDHGGDMYRREPKMAQLTQSGTTCKACNKQYNKGSPGFDFSPYCSRGCRDNDRRSRHNLSAAAKTPIYADPERSKDTAVTEDSLDTAERELPKKVMPGARVRVKRKLAAPTRGGGRIVLAAGTVGTVIRDLAGDGQQLYIEFDDGVKAVIQTKYLTGSSSKKKAQLEEEAGFKDVLKAIPLATTLMVGGPAQAADHQHPEQGQNWPTLQDPSRGKREVELPDLSHPDIYRGENAKQQEQKPEQTKLNVARGPAVNPT